jgi:hypothetical protein
MRVALGLKARTGRAILVALGGELRELHVIERSQLQLLPEGAFAPYHAAEGLAPAAAREHVRQSIATAHRLAAEGVRGAATRLATTGHEVVACGILVGAGMPAWTTDEILAVHVRMHKAEGELFREVLVAGARACGLPVTTLRHKSALDDASKLLALPRSQLAELLAASGRAVGAPWGADQKEAAAAAIAALFASCQPAAVKRDA